MSSNDDSQESENEFLPLETILSNLKAIANKVRTNFDFCKSMKDELETFGYGWFGDTDRYRRLDFTQQVMKVLAVAVNEAIQKKVDLQNQHPLVEKQELDELLGIHEDKTLGHYFFQSVSFVIPPGPRQKIQPWKRMLQTARSPPEMAKYLSTRAPQRLVKKMIEHQFDIRWNTVNTLPPTGEPADYTFYEFCDKENTTKYFTSIPRQAHVKATLYKECRRRNVCELRSIIKEELCPKLYIRTADGWESWLAHKNEFNDVIDINDDLSWMDKSIRKFITENADEQKVAKNSLDKPTLYWAVLYDDDFESGNKLKIKPIGKTQVYVGKADNGVRGRWIKDSDNHCAMMKECLDNVCAMTTYDPLRLKGVQLVDARLALAKVRRKKTALFVIKTFGDDDEKAEITLQQAETSLSQVVQFFEVNYSKRSSKDVLRVLKKFEAAESSFRQARQSCSKSLSQVADQPDLNCLSEAKDSCREFLSEAEKSFREAQIFCSPISEAEKHFSERLLHQAPASYKTFLKEVKKILSQVQQVKESFNKVITFLHKSIPEKEVKKRLDKLKAIGKDELKKAEKFHRDGNRVDGKTKIIQTEDIEWSPTNMRYGMNCK